jgi:hypothetical protein
VHYWQGDDAHGSTAGAAHKAQEATLERENAALRAKLLRRSAIIDSIRKSYIVDVITVKAELLACCDWTTKHAAECKSGSDSSSSGAANKSNSNSEAASASSTAVVKAGQYKGRDHNGMYAAIDHLSAVQL